MLDINQKLKNFIINLYLRSIIYRKRHIRKDNYNWLKNIDLQIINKNEGKFFYQDLQYLLPKNNYKSIPLHQKYLYAALINKYDIPKHFLLFWDSLIVINEIFIRNLYNKEFQIKKDDIVFDIGASIGWYACKISKIIGNEGKIVAIEPNPKNFNFSYHRYSMDDFISLIHFQFLTLGSYFSLYFITKFFTR